MKTYKGRTEEEQKEYNAKRRAYFKALKENRSEQHMNAVLSGSIEEEREEDNTLEINPVVSEKLEPVKLSFKERMLAKFTGSDSERDGEESDIQKAANKEHTKNSYKLISHALPMALSALVAIYARRLFTEEYKACAPKREEVATILMPIFSIFSRMIEIETKASQNAIDAVAAIMAAITVGTRMLMTAEDIKNHAGSNTGTNARDNRTNASSNGANASGNSATENVTNIRAYHAQDGTNSRGSGPDGSNGNGNDTNGYINERSYEAAQVAFLLRRDTEGRRQMGLAPRIVRD